MIPLAIRPNPPKHVDFNSYYVPRYELGWFADKESWRSAIFAHLRKSPEQLMQRLWQCVEANHEDRTPPSLEDLLEPPPTPLWRILVIGAVWGFLLLTCIRVVYRCLLIRVR